MNSYSTDPKDIRKFGAIGFLFFGVLAGVALWRQKPVPTYLFATLAVLFTGFCLLPEFLTPAYRAWMRAAHFIGTVFTAVILTLAYYLVVTPYGLIKRLFGDRLLAVKRDERLPSYWVDRTEPAQPRERFHKRY
jgi:hypothetical protein